MKSFTLSRSLIGVTVLLGMTQCQNIHTQSPKAEGFDPAIPAEMSYLAGPITIQLRELEDKINRELDPVLVGKGSKGGKQGGIFSFRVERSGPVRIHYADQQMRFSAPLQLWLAKPFSSDTTAPKKPFCSLNINFQSPLRVTPDWRLASHIQFTDFQWIIKPEIRLLGKEIPLANFARNILEKHQSAIEKAIDSAIYNDLRLDKTVSPIWRDIQKPLLINKEYGVWLLPKPVGVEASPITGNAKETTTHLRIAFETQTELKPEQPVHPVTPLARLEKRDQVAQTSDLHVMSFIPYADINRMLTRTIGEEKKLALGMLTVKHASVFGSQRALIIKTDVNGLLDGTLYLRGRPVFDTLTKTLSVENLDFDAGTADAVSKLSTSLVHNAVCKLLATMLTIPLGDGIAQLPEKISKAFEKSTAAKKTQLGIKSFRFTPQRIAVRPDGIQALIKVESTVAVQVKKL